MNILCLGCSWTQGVSHQPLNWVHYLAKALPDHKFYNFALRGSSLMHSVWLLESVLNKQNFNIEVDKIIFQVTNEGRVTTYSDDFVDINLQDLVRHRLPIRQDVLNYYELDLTEDHNIWNKMSTINYATLNDKKAPKFAKQYYLNLNRRQHFDIEHKALIEYIRPKVDYMFLHKAADINIPNIDCMEKRLGYKRFKKFCIDGDAAHFSVEGVQWQAEYIKSKVFDLNT